MKTVRHKFDWKTIRILTKMLKLVVDTNRLHLSVEAKLYVPKKAQK